MNLLQYHYCWNVERRISVPYPTCDFSIATGINRGTLVSLAHGKLHTLCFSTKLCSHLQVATHEIVLLWYYKTKLMASTTL